MAKQKHIERSKIDWDDRFVWLARMYFSRGGTAEGFANMIGAELEQVELWRQNMPEFGAALNEVQGMANSEVEFSLFKLCTGFYFDIEYFNKKNQPKIMSKYYPPDLKAIKFWLVNNANYIPDTGRIELTGRDGGSMRIDNMITLTGNDEELREVIESARILLNPGTDS
jgi:hypothetical protein